METEFAVLTGGPEDSSLYERAGACIRSGGLVAFPTETVYGLGGNGLDRTASGRIYAAKGRPSDNPLILHIARREDLLPLVKAVPSAADRLMDAFWPGPLTLIFRKNAVVPDETTGGLDTVAVRMPSHPAATAFLLAAGVPVAAPSANLSGRPSPTSAEHVRADMDGRIEMILDGGPCDIGLESTIVDVTEEVPVILRPGYIGLAALRELLGEIRVDPAVLSRPSEEIRPKAPGMKYRHYAPQAEMLLVEGPAGAVEDYIAEQCLGEETLRCGVLCSTESAPHYRARFEKAGRRLPVFPLGSLKQDEEIARHLFAALREVDRIGLDRVYTEAFRDGPLAEAIMNRLKKAAGYRIIEITGKE